MKVIAHRGFWTVKQEMNTEAAFRRALDSGFGIETDFRDAGGRLVIAHNPPVGDEMNADYFFSFARSYVEGIIAINVKADGLQELLTAAASKLAPDRHFVFDMSVPDTLRHFATPLPVFVRASEFEQPGALLLSRAAGVWLDAFHNEWYTEETIAAFRLMGLRVCLVSPELHCRPHQREWHRLRDWGIAADDGFLLCTDFPDQAKDFFR